MAEQSLKDKTVKGVIWSFIDRFSSQLVQFVVALILARLLTPHEYGVIGMISVFIALSQSLIDSGFSQALIRKNYCTNIDFSTVFYFNVLVSLLVYGLFYVISPLVEIFYGENHLASVMRWLSIVVLINAFSVVPKAIFTIRLNFKVQTLASLLAATISGATGIFVAYYFRNVWALVVQQISYAFISVVVLWTFSKWHPILAFSYSSFKEMFSFGSKLMAVGIINTLFNNLYPVVVGKVYNPTTLGFYTRAQNFAELPAMNITGIVQRVSYPVMCQIQEDKQRFTIFFCQILEMTAFIYIPLMCILASISIPLVDIVLGEKWHFCGVLMIPLCFSMMWYPFHALNLNILEVVGKSDLFLKLEIIKKTITVLVLCISIPFGILALCYAQAAVSLLFVFINAWYTRNYVDLTTMKQLRMYLPALTTSLITFFIVVCCGRFLPSTGWLVIGVLGGGGLYLLVSSFAKFNKFPEIINVLKHGLRNK